MTARTMDFSVLLLDVGPNMTLNLPYVRRAALTYLHNKLTDKLKHEVAIVLYGTAGSDNNLYNEHQDLHGGEAQYANITTVCNMGLPTIDTVAALDAALAAVSDQGPVAADMVNAVTVAFDLILRRVKEDPKIEKGSKRVILVSNFLTPATEDDETQNFIDSIMEEVLNYGITLQVVSIDIPTDDAEYAADKDANKELIEYMFSKMPDYSEKIIDNAVDIAGVFPANEHLPTYTLVSITFRIGSKLKIPVKFAAKSDKERYPPMDKESPLVPATQPAGGGGGVDDEQATAAAAPCPAASLPTYGQVKRSTNLFKMSDTDRQMPLEEQDTEDGYRYGKELAVPSVDELDAATYEPEEKGAVLLGFLNKDAEGIPRHFYKAKSMVMVASKGGTTKKDAEIAKAAGNAMSALVRALHRKEQVAIFRLVRKVGGKVEIALAEPVVGHGNTGDHFLVNILPFYEDVRTFTFSTFERDDRRPSAAQMEAMSNLISSMSLVSSEEPEHEDLKCETTANPTLHRFINVFMEKALQHDAPVPVAEDDDLLQRVMAINTAEMPKAEAAAAAAAAAFPTGQAAKAMARALYRLRPGHEAEDFATMMSQENYADAINAMRKHVETVVDTSPGEYRYGDAVEAFKVLRQGCITARQYSAFNNQLIHLEKKYGSDTTKLGFWRMVCDAGVKLVSVEEVDEVGVGASDRPFERKLPTQAEAEEMMHKGRTKESEDVGGRLVGTGTHLGSMQMG